MRHIKRGYNWFFTKIAAILGLFIGSEVFTINNATGNIHCNYNSSNTATYTSADGKIFSYCSGNSGWDWCSGNISISSTNYCQPNSILRYYFFFMGCPENHYANYAYGAELTPELRHGTGSNAGLNTSLCSSKCYNIPTTGKEWRSLTSAKATAESMVTCTPCPPYGEYDAKSDGTGLISTCYMSSATSYNDPTGSGVHTWTDNCHYEEE